MSAPDYTFIFDVEGQVENSVAAILASAPYSLAHVFTPRESQINVYPNIMVIVQRGEEQGHRGVIGDGSGNFAADAWHATLNLRVETKRPDTTIGQHSTLRGLVQEPFQYFKSAFTSVTLPYHVLTMMKFQGCQQSFSDDIDISELTYQLVVSVRPGAWPTA